jgi:hypothetical protein
MHSGRMMFLPMPVRKDAVGFQHFVPEQHCNMAEIARRTLPYHGLKPRGARQAC